jgi:hypothetical protein
MMHDLDIEIIAFPEYLIANGAGSNMKHLLLVLPYDLVITNDSIRLPCFLILTQASVGLRSRIGISSINTISHTVASRILVICFFDHG